MSDELERRFTFQGLASRGGMGAVYKAVDLGTGATVAIKLIDSAASNVRRRFMREGKILAQLSHPHIVRYLEHGSTESGQLYLVMEWLEGEDLAARLTRARLREDEALAMIRSVCTALGLAHSSGIVHRDIKPGNLFLVGGDPKSVKLLDFGIARASQATNSVTGAPSLIGTVGYMAPEQVLCEQDVDERADVFAVGCVLYECLTGKAPFASAHAVGVLAKVLREEPQRPSHVRSELHSRIDGFVGRLLAKRRADRPRDGAAIVAELDVLSSQPSEGRAPSSSNRPAPPGSEQRIVTVILGRPSSTREAAGEPASGEDVYALASPHVGDVGDVKDAVLEKLSTRFDVEVAQLQGGAVLLVLSGRGQAIDRATRAALCALDLSSERPDLTLAIATGLADTSGNLPVGAAIDRAAKSLGLSTGEAPNIRIDDVTCGLIGFRFDVRHESDTMLLVGPRSQLDATTLLMGRPTPHVGRDREMAMLDATLAECISDDVSRTVLVTGPPGIGKSRLAGEWLSRNRSSREVNTFFARADPGSASSALSLLRQLLRNAVGIGEAEEPGVQRALLFEHLASVEPAQVEVIAEVMGLWDGEEPSPALRAARASPDVMQEMIRRALRAWLDGEASRGPLVVVLEDLHWGDTPSVTFLIEALRENVNRPLMVLGLARPETERQFAQFGDHAALQIRLQGLSARAAQQLVMSALGGNPDEAVVSRVIRTADGNPFYLEELIRRVAAGSTEWPDTVLAMAQSRIQELDFEARFALRAASVFGERAWDSGVQEIIGGDHDAPTLLTILAREELLSENAQSRYPDSREYRFRHALLRDAAYAMWIDADRRASHRLAAAWLEENHEKDARVLADHFEAAGLTERALPWLIRATKATIDAGDLVQTIELANRGVKMGATGVERGRLLLARAYAEAQRSFPELGVAREALDLLPVGSAQWWLALATFIYGTHILGKGDEAAPYIALAESSPFSSEPDVPFGQGLVTVVGGLVLLGKTDAAELILDRVGRAAASASEPDPIFSAFLSSARCALVSVAPVRGKWELERAFFGGRASVDALRRLGAVHGESVALYYFASAAIHLGLYEEAAKAAELSVELTQRASSSIEDGWNRLLWARALLRQGRPDEAMKTVSQLGASPNRIVRHMLPVVLAEIHLRRGDFAAAEAEAAPACAGLAARVRRMAACVLARTQLISGRAELALATVDVGLGKQTSPGLESDIDLLTLRAEALHALGRIEEAVDAILTATGFVLDVAKDIDDPVLKRSFLEQVEPCARAISLRTAWILP